MLDQMMTVVVGLISCSAHVSFSERSVNWGSCPVKFDDCKWCSDSIYVETIIVLLVVKDRAHRMRTRCSLLIPERATWKEARF
jgi:hypothetical protein